MGRSTDWWVLDLPSDPTPGTPDTAESAARRWGALAEDAARAERAVRGLAGDNAVLTWIGAAEQWMELRLSPGSPARDARDLVEERVRAVPELREHRGALVKVLREASRRAWDAGATYCACFAQSTSDGPVTGAVTVSVVRGPVDVPANAGDRTQQLVDRLRVKEPESEHDIWSSVTTVDVPGVGLCPQTYGVEDLPLPDDAGIVRSVVMQTFVPVPDDARVVLVTASSPAVALSDVLLDLFDAVSSTFRLVETSPLDHHGEL